VNIEIYVVGHKNFSKIPSKDVFIPIQVGLQRGGGDGIAFCPLADNTGDNISDKNDSFCELTALYWIWKNTGGQDYVGLLHYRRHFNMSDKLRHEDQWGNICYPNINEQYLKENVLNDAQAEKLCSEFDIILPQKWDVRRSGKWTSIYDHYMNADHHFIKDYEAALAILRRKYPEYIPYIDSFNAGASAYWCNMFIMRRGLFDKYCAWIFDILFLLEKELDISHYNTQERRVFGYLAERLSNIWLEKLFADRPDLKVKTLQRTFVADTSVMPSVNPYWQNNNIGIAMAFNDAFAPYAGVTMRSIAENSFEHKNYDIVVFDGGISAENKRLLEVNLQEFPNFKIRYINDADIKAFHDGMFIHSHFSRDMYCRLYIPRIFSSYRKVIYIDADMIIQHDIAELVDIDLQKKALGAVQDCVMIGFRQEKVRSHPEGFEADIYLRHCLGMRNPDGYFNSGVLVFSIAEAERKDAQIDAIMSAGRSYWFPDQDILNMIYEGDVYYLDERWNVLNGNGDTETFFKRLPEPVKSTYFKSRKDPFLLHFAGPNKPWRTDKGDFHDVFWKYARLTIWYEAILRNFILVSMPVAAPVFAVEKKRLSRRKKIKREVKRIVNQVKALRFRLFH